jgi:hypothetical protein
MKKLVLALVLILVALLVVINVTAVAAPGSDEEAVRAAADHYLKGHATGSPDEFRQAFHPESKLFWVKDGQLSQRTSAEYIAGAKGKPADDEAQRKRRIASVDVTGDAAVVKVELDYPNAVLTDYLSMLKVNGEWKIVNKIFHSRPKPKP